MLELILSNLTKQHQLQEPPLKRFHQAQDRINAEPPTARNDTMENTMEQQGYPPTTHIKPREPIINQDYATAPIDLEAALFVIQSYEDARVVDIDGNILTAGQLRRNVSGIYNRRGNIVSDPCRQCKHVHTYYVLTQPFVGHKCLCPFEQC